MSPTVRAGLAPVAVLLAAVPLFAQEAASDKPTRFVPVKPSSPREKKRLEAQKLYALGAIHEKHNRLLEATRAYEKARALDPDAAAVHRALIPLYLALERTDDALAACRKALALAPDDYETGYLYARQLRKLNRPKEALPVLRKAAAAPGLKDNLELKAQILFDLAVLNEEAGNFAAAERRFRAVTAVLDDPAAIMRQGPYNREEINSQAAETWERLGRVCLKAGHPDRAITAFRTAQKKDPLRASRLAYNLAEVYIQQGDPRAALARLEDYLRAQPQGMEGYELKIKLQRQLGRDADILPQLEMAAGRDPHNTSLQLLLAREYRAAHRYRQAETLYERLAKESPAPEVYRGLFDVYKDDAPGGADRALTRLNEAVAKAIPKDDATPGDPSEAAHARAMLLALRGDGKFVRRLLVAADRRATRGRRLPPGAGPGGRPTLVVQTRLLLAALAGRTGQLDVAERLYRSCLDVGRPVVGEHQAYLGLLDVLSRAHKYREMVTVCEQGLKKAAATNRVLFHAEKATAYLGLNQMREALTAIDAAVEDSDDSSRLGCRCRRARILAEAGRKSDAVAECQSLLKEYNLPGDVRRIRYTLSAIYSTAHDLAAAEGQLKLILESDPDDATANNDLGYQWAEQNKNLEEAETRIRRALELDRRQRDSGTAVDVDSDQENAAYVDSLGWVLFRRGRLAEARRELEKAAALPDGADDPVVWDHLGDVCYRQGDKRKAAACWRKALARFDAGARRPDERYKEIKDKLGLLEP